MKEKKDSYEIDAMHIVGLLLKRWWAILLFVLVFSLMAFGYTELFVASKYQSTATLLINGESSISSAYQQILAGQYQSKDYPYILNSNDTLTKAANQLNEYSFPENGGVPYRTYNANVLRGMIRSEAVEESRIFTITATSSDATEAMLVAKVVAAAFKTDAVSFTKSEVGIIDNPTVPASPVSKGYGRNILIGFAIGLILGFAYAIFVGLLNDGIESEDWLLETFEEDIPLLAVVPDSNGDGRGDKYYYNYRTKYAYTSSESKE